MESIVLCCIQSGSFMSLGPLSKSSSPCRKKLCHICLNDLDPLIQLNFSYLKQIAMNRMMMGMGKSWAKVYLATGCPKSKSGISNCSASETTHFWPHVGKAKLCFGGLHLFWFFSCLFTIFSCLFTIFKNKWRPPKHILALPTWVQKCIFSEL